MSEQAIPSRSGAILVVGGGISGITAAVEAAEVGHDVYLVEQGPSLGGRVAQMNKYFPKLCPPACGLEINYQRIRKSPGIRVFTMAEVESVSGSTGAFDVTLKIKPRYINEKCTACGECEKACQAERADDFNFGMNKTKAVYLPHDMAFPVRYALDKEAALAAGENLEALAAACPYGAIEPGMKEARLPIQVGSIVVATGWAPYDAARMENLGLGRCANVVTNMMMERMASRNGPTGGQIVRPSDGQPVKTAVFVQCAGSRDANYLPYCSSICCLASMKQATYLCEQNPDARIHVFYIDLRASGQFEDFLAKCEADDRIVARKGKVAKIEEDPATKNMIVEVEDILQGGKIKVEADLAVLAAGMIPSAAALPIDLDRDEYGFASGAAQPAGIAAAGAAKGPRDVASSVQDATAAALEAVRSARGIKN